MSLVLGPWSLVLRSFLGGLELSLGGGFLGSGVPGCSMVELSNDQKRELVARAVDAQERAKREPITGPATGLRCRCGGVLHESIPPVPRVPGTGPRRSRNRRIRKKQLKRWMRTTGATLLYIHMGMTRRPRGYRCAACLRPVDFYRAIAEGVLGVESLPTGALPIYEAQV
jgi:hypothetical protein